jgi:hypothetical protein
VISFAAYAVRVARKSFYTYEIGSNIISLTGCDVISLADRRH